jgi:hypothetical protein
MKLESGDIVVVAMHSPREKILGVLREINSAGVYVRGIDLNAFDDFVGATKSGEAFFGMSEQFLPLWRVERIERDETSGEIPSMQDQFLQQTGQEFHMM